MDSKEEEICDDVVGVAAGIFKTYPSENKKKLSVMLQVSLKSSRHENTYKDAEEGDARSEGTFRFVIPNFSRLKKSIYSDPYFVRNLPWKIMATQRSNQTKDGENINYLGFFLQCNAESESASWSCNAVAELRLLSVKVGGNPFTRKVKHLFHSEEYDWGFSHFIPWNDVLDPKKGYIKNDVITLEVWISADFALGLPLYKKKPKGSDGLKNKETSFNMNSLQQGLYFCNQLRNKKRPQYGIYGYHSDQVSYHRQFRLTRFEKHQEELSIDLTFEVEGIGSVLKENIIVDFTSRSLNLKIKNIEDEDVYFYIPKLAHRIFPNQSFFRLINQDCICITLQKAKARIWKTVYYNPQSVKRRWTQQMRGLLDDIPSEETGLDDQYMIAALKEVWDEAQILCVDDINFFLNPPHPFGPIKALQSIRTIDEVINNVKHCIVSRSDLLYLKADFLGAAVLYKCQQQYAQDVKVRPEVATVSSDEEECESKADSEVRISIPEQEKRKLVGDRKKDFGNEHFRLKNYEKALKYYSFAIDCYSDSSIYYTNRSACYFMLKEYDRSLFDACRAIDLDPLFEKGFFRAGKALLALELPDLARQIVNYAMEFDAENRKDFPKLVFGNPETESSGNRVRCDKSSKIYQISKQRLKEMKNLKKLQDVNYHFIKKKDFCKVKELAQELCRQKEFSIVSNAYYYLSYCAYNLDDRDFAFNYLDMCLIYNPGNAAAKRLGDKIKDVYDARDNGFLKFYGFKPEESLDLYKKGLTIDPQNMYVTSTFHFLIGLVKKSLGRTEEAIKSFNTSIGIRNNVATVYYLRGDCHEKMGRKAEANRDIERAVEIYINDNVRIKGEKFKRQLDDTPRYIEELEYYYADKGMKQFVIQNYRAAIEYYKLATHIYPFDTQSYCQRVLCFKFLGRYDDALMECSHILKLDPKCENAYLFKTALLIPVGKYEPALRCLTKAKKIFPKNPDIRSEMNKVSRLKSLIKQGSDAMNKEEYGKAVDFYFEAKEIAYADFSLHMKINSCFAKINDMNPEPIISMNGNEDSSTHYQKGLFCYLRCQKKECLQHFDKALELDPSNVKAKEGLVLAGKVFAFHELAHGFLKDKKYERSLTAFKNSLPLLKDHNQMSAKTYYGMGLVYLEQNEIDEAMKHFILATENDTTLSDAYVKRSECYQALGQPKKALKELQSAFGCAPSPEVMKKIMDLKNFLRFGTI